MRYCDFQAWRARSKSTTLPKNSDGTVDQSRVEALLDDAAVRCMGSVPGALIDADGSQIANDDLPAPLLDACVYWSAALVDCWLMPGADGKRIEATLFDELAASLHGVVSVTAHREDAEYDEVRRAALRLSSDDRMRLVTALS